MVHYSVIIPAYNEQLWLVRSLPVLRDAMTGLPWEGEVIVVDNNSTDLTAQVARDHGARVVFEPRNQISRARNAGARVAQGRFLVFLDADTSLSRELLHSALHNLEERDCCGGGALVTFDPVFPRGIRWMLTLWNSLALRLHLAAGCFIYCLREAYEDIGGFSERVFVSEEIWFSRALRKWGRPRKLAFLVIAQPRIRTSSRKVQVRPVRNLLAFFFVLVFPPAIYSRKLSALWYQRK